MEDRELINDFLVESGENLSRLDLEMVELEKTPKDATLLASVFRTFHTLKGTCGFFGFDKLEAIAHGTESILSQLREGERPLTPELVSLILETVDAIKQELTAIEATGQQSEQAHADLRQRLAVACDLSGRAEPAPQPQGAGESVVAPEPAPAPEPEAPGVEVASAADAGGPNGAPGEPQKAAAKGSSAVDSTIRVDVGLLDKLMNLVGELVLARNQILQFNATQEDFTLNATSQHLNLITSQLQEGVMKTRMQPIGMVWNKLPRVVRDIAAACGKQIVLEMDGAETELDKSIIEAIRDPLTHIVRNCCDHGIELPEERLRAGKPARGTLALRAFHEGGQVNIEISDNGAGIDPQRIKEAAVRKGLLRLEQAERLSDREAINMVFLPGFSTAEQVTSISGRGVGMDVIKTNIEKIGGSVDLASTVGEGTTVKIKIPLTLAIIPGLVVTVGNRRSVPRDVTGSVEGERFVIPQVSLVELIRLEGEAGRKQIEDIQGTQLYRRRGLLLPIVYLNKVLRLDGASSDSGVVNIVVLQAEDRQFGLVVEGISDTQEIVVKPLGRQLKGLTCYAGATIMGDGKVALILDLLGIAQRSGVLAESHELSRGEAGERKEHGDRDQQSYLLFRAGKFERLAVPLSLVARLEEIPQAKIEQASGDGVVQYRGEILRLVTLGSVLYPGLPDSTGTQDPAQVIVVSNVGRHIGILVDQIVDIVEASIVVRQQTGRPGLLGSAVIGGKVTDLLDLYAVIETVERGWFDKAAGPRKAAVLIAEGSTFTRGMIRAAVEMAGHQAIEATNVTQALAVLERGGVDVVLAALDLPPKGGAELLERMRRHPELARVPGVALVDQPPELHPQEGMGDGFQAYHLKYDRVAILKTIESLTAAADPAEPVGVEERR